MVLTPFPLLVFHLFMKISFDFHFNLFSYDHTRRSQLGMVTANKLLKINTVFKIVFTARSSKAQLAAYSLYHEWYEYSEKNTQRPIVNVRLQY